MKVSGLSYQNELEMKCPVLHGPTDCDGASTYTDILALFENGRREVRIECLRAQEAKCRAQGLGKAAQSRMFGVLRMSGAEWFGREISSFEVIKNLSWAPGTKC